MSLKSIFPLLTLLLAVVDPAAGRAALDDSAVVTSTDATECGSVPKNNWWTWNYFGSLPQNAVWKVGTRRWTAWDERDFAYWVQREIKPDFLTKNRIAADCADFPIILRLIFSRMRNLPFLVKSGRKTFGHFSTNYASYPTVHWTRDWQASYARDLRLQAMYADIATEFGTTNFARNLYPVKLRIDWRNPLLGPIRPGTVFSYNEYSPKEKKYNGHVEVVTNVGGGYNPIVILSSTTGQKSPLLFQSGLGIPNVPTPGYGATNWRWVVNCDGDWRHVAPERHADFDATQEQNQLPIFGEPYNDLIKRKEDLTREVEELEDKLENRLPRADRTRLETRLAEKYQDLQWLETSIGWRQRNPGKPVWSRGFYNAVQAFVRNPRFENPTDAEIRVMLNDYHERVKGRVTIVNGALALLSQNRHAFDQSTEQGRKTFDDWSTPNRDRRIYEIWESLIEMIARKGRQAGWDLRRLQSALMSQKIELGNGATTTTWNFVQAMKAGATSPNPGDSLEKRWGLSYRGR